MAGFGDALRGLGSVLNPQVAQEISADDRQQQQFANQIGLMGLQQRLQQNTPEWQAKIEALKNEKLFRDEVAGAGGDLPKIASAAVKYGKPDLAVTLLNQQEQRAARVQQASEALEVKKLQLQQNHELALQRMTDGKERQAEIERHNKAIELLGSQSAAARQEALTMGNQIKLMQLELQGNKAEADKLRGLNTQTSKLSTALEKANLPEADATLGAVEDMLKKNPGLAEYITGPKSLLPDAVVGPEVTSARQAFNKLFNVTLKLRSGAAVTQQELDRLKQEFAVGVAKKPEQVGEAVKQARNIISRHYQSVVGGYGPDVLNAYNENVRQVGGRPVLEQKPAGASGGWTVEEVK